MKNLVLITAVAFLMAACNSNKNTEQGLAAAGIHTAVTEEVLQTSQYTYLRVKEGEQERWLAGPKMEASVGETYYYKNAMLMPDFASKELNRTFKEIYFVDKINKNAEAVQNAPAPPAMPDSANKATAAAPGNGADANAGAADEHKVVADEVLQTNQYTYIHAKEGTNDLWLAAAKMNATKGTTYYFHGGLPMKDFVSKELKKTFKDILFVDNITDNPGAAPVNAADNNAASQPVSTGSAIPIEKKEVKITHAKGDLTIASLYENKKSYAGKTVKIKGQVTKYSGGIMKKNWIHLQDGTDFSGKFDLTITTDQEVKVGDTITAEGIITLDKDFGYNYFYDVIMEDGKVTK